MGDSRDTISAAIRCCGFRLARLELSRALGCSHAKDEKPALPEVSVRVAHKCVLVAATCLQTGNGSRLRFRAIVASKEALNG